MGVAVLLLILIIELAIEEGHDVDEDQVLKEIFPMFRGMAIIIIYMGLLAWNVYGWTKYNVNYKLIFRFNHHYSQMSQVKYFQFHFIYLFVDIKESCSICNSIIIIDAMVSYFRCQSWKNISSTRLYSKRSASTHFMAGLYYLHVLSIHQNL